MAKVMVSLPDDLLDDIDRRARSEGLTRSGLLQRLAARELASETAERQRRLRDLLSDPPARDARATEHLRAARRSR